MFVVAIICFIIGVVLIGAAFVVRSGWTGLGGGVAIALGVMFMAFSTFYTQDVGEARILRDWTGNLVGDPVTSSGGHWKEPWVDTVEFDIRNQPAIFIGDGKDSYNGQQPNGPQITFQDKEGVTGNMDLVVIYSIDPNSITDIYKQYLNQDNFRTRLIEQTVRSVPRDVASKFGTLDMFTNRGEVAAEIQQELEDSWKGAGVIVESVSLQEIRYSDDVKARFDQAQQARIDVETSKANLEKSKVDAQQKVVQAQAEADANNILAKSLTPQILQQRYIDMLSKAQTIIVPQDFTALGTIK